MIDNINTKTSNYTVSKNARTYWKQAGSKSTADKNMPFIIISFAVVHEWLTVYAAISL